MRHHEQEHLIYADLKEYDIIFNQFNRFIMHCIQSFYNSIGRKITKEEKEDIFQEVALKILKNGYIRKYDNSKSNMTTWLGMIARTAAIDHLRKRRMDMLPLERDPEAAAPTLESQVEPLPLPTGVLTDRQRQIIELGFRDGLRSTEIASRLGITPRTARSLKCQALARLRTHYGLPESG